MKQAIIKCCKYVIRIDSRILEQSVEVERTHRAFRFRHWSNTFLPAYASKRGWIP